MLFVATCPHDLQAISDSIIVCSQCNTQLTKGQWPTKAFTNDLVPDGILVELASLTPDEVRTITLICPLPEGYNPTRWPVWRRRFSHSFPIPSSTCDESATKTSVGV